MADHEDHSAHSGHGDHGPAPTPPPRMEDGHLAAHPAGAPGVIDDDLSRLFTSLDFQSLDTGVQDALSHRIDLYYDQPLELFPYGELNSKPDRFHVLFIRQIEERFPDDAKMRGEIREYGRFMFRALLTYMLGKRLMQASSLAGLAALAVFGPAWLSAFVTGAPIAAIATGLAMLVLFGIYVGVNTVVFTQYRFGLENRSYALSREIVQHTRELQNDYTTIRALPDQSETLFQSNGAAWGARSAFLIRLLMWLAARLEYLEKYVQVEMWRVRRERYWMDWAGGILTVAVLLGFVAWLALQPAPAGDPVMFRALQGLAGLLALVTTWASFFRWRTPIDLVHRKLDPESWIRYSTLNLDNTVGDQIKRDKERLVEYRHLTRGR